MNRIFNAYILLSTIIFLTPALSFNLYANPATSKLTCPAMKTAEEAVEFFVQADMVGARLTADTVAKLKKCVSFDDENAWDVFQVVSSYELKECSGIKTKDTSCVEIKYGTYGNLYSSQPFNKNKELQFVTQKLYLTKTGEAWSIKGLREVPPMLNKEGAVSYLQMNEDKQNTKEKNEWLRSAALDIESLK